MLGSDYSDNPDRKIYIIKITFKVNRFYQYELDGCLSGPVQKYRHLTVSNCLCDIVRR
jgi:hypothetical protein